MLINHLQVTCSQDIGVMAGKDYSPHYTLGGGLSYIPIYSLMMAIKFIPTAIRINQSKI